MPSIQEAVSVLSILFFLSFSFFFWRPCLWDLSFPPGIEFPGSEAVNIH